MVPLFVGLFLLTAAATTPPLPSTCVYLPSTRLVGGNLNQHPILNLRSPSACCDACLQYRGSVPCTAYTFEVSSDGATRCWLKRGPVYTRPDFLGSAGFPNFFYNATHPDLSNDLGVLFSGGYDAAKFPLRFAFDLVDGEWDVDVSFRDQNTGYWPPEPPSLPWRALPAECKIEEGMKLNMAVVSPNTARLPILNLACPEDCRKACYDHQEESGRYSCVAYNFKYTVPVSECWLKAQPMGKVMKFGMVSGLSGREGWELGPAPTDYLELRDLYRDLIAKAMICIDTEA